MPSFGIAITNLTSKFGILSRKASIRIATKTGEKDLSQPYRRIKSEFVNYCKTHGIQEYFEPKLGDIRITVFYFISDKSRDQCEDIDRTI